MKISIVTLSFNQFRFLPQTFESVVTQDHNDIEYIVVDPGSSDGSRAFLEGHSDQAILVLEPDKGPPDGLNKGFGRATGDVYGFLNSDDYLLPGALRAVACHFEAHPEADMLLGSGLIVDESGNTLRRVRARSFSPDRWLHGGTRWMQQSIFFRAGAFRKAGGFNVSNMICWDGELFLKIGLAGARVHYLDQDLACFRRHRSSITGRSGEKGSQLPHLYLRETRRIFREHYGRDWGWQDELMKLAFKIEAACFHPSEILQSLLFRIRSRVVQS